jgi:DNA repair protein RecO (recombination protein O)
VGAIGKAVRKPESKLGPSLELYGHVDVLLARGRGELDVIAQVQRVPGYRIEGDVSLMAHAALIAELAERVCEDRHPIDGVYELAVSSLAELARETDPRRSSAWFLMSALDLLGYAPQLINCASCERPLAARPAPFSAEAGGFLCDRCALPAMEPAPLAAIKVLRLMATGDSSTYRRLKLDSALMNAIDGVLQSQLEYHMDRRLKSLAFLRSSPLVGRWREAPEGPEGVKSSPRSGEVAPQAPEGPELL